MKKIQAISKRERHSSVTIAAWGVFLLGAVNIWQAVGFARQQPLLHRYNAAVNPIFLQTVAWFLAVVFIVQAILIGYQYRPVRLITPLSLVLFALYHLVLRFIVVPTSIAQQGWPLLAFILVTLILYVTWTLNRYLNPVGSSHQTSLKP